MISQNNTDYMSWSQFLKGNYRKGVKRLESILNNPLQAADFIEDKVALAVIFGGYDKQTDGLLNVVANSRYADQMTQNYIGSVADSDAGFAAVATPEMAENVCLASDASAACAKKVWKNDPERFIARAKDDVQLDLAAKAFKSIDVVDFDNLPNSALSKLSLYVGRNDRDDYLHLVGRDREIEFGAVGRLDGYYDLSNDSLRRIEFVIVDVNADRDASGNTVGFTLASKYPFSIDTGSSYGINYNVGCVNYYYSRAAANPTYDSATNSSYISASAFIPRRLSRRNSYTPLFKGEIIDIARSVRKTWLSTGSSYLESSTDYSEQAAYLPFWQPSLRNLFGDGLEGKLDGKWCFAGDGGQYQHLKDFSNLKRLSVEPDYYYSITGNYSSDKAVAKVAKYSYSDYLNNAHNPFMGSYYPKNMLTSSWLLDGALSSESQYLRIPVINADGSIDGWAGSTSSGNNISYMPNIYMCI